MHPKILTFLCLLFFLAAIFSVSYNSATYNTSNTINTKNSEIKIEGNNIYIGGLKMTYDSEKFEASQSTYFLDVINTDAQSVVIGSGVLTFIDIADYDLPVDSVPEILYLVGDDYPLNYSKYINVLNHEYELKAKGQGGAHQTSTGCLSGGSSQTYYSIIADRVIVLMNTSSSMSGCDDSEITYTEIPTKDIQDELLKIIETAEII